MTRWYAAHMTKAAHSSQWAAWDAIEAMAARHGAVSVVHLNVYPCRFANRKECGKVAPLHWHVGHLIGLSKM